MKTILVPTDGSHAAEKALGLALDLAEKHGATVKLLHVLLADKEPCELLRLPDIQSAGDSIVSALQGLEDGPEVVRTAEELMGQRNTPDRPAPAPLLREIGNHVLERAKGQAASRGIAVDVMSLSDGAAAPAIVEAAADAKADAIVMGSRGLRQIESVAFGSVSQEVCRSTACTCVAVH